MASNTTTTTSRIVSKKGKLHVLLIPFFATSHIQPLTQLAIRLAAANDAVEATIAVTPASVPIVQSLVDSEDAAAAVKIASYPFPTVDGIRKGVENVGKASTPEESSLFELAVSLARPKQDSLIREQAPDAIITDQLFFWNGGVAGELGVPCVAFSVLGAFSMLAMRHLADVGNDDVVMEVPRFPIPCIKIPKRELPVFLRTPQPQECSDDTGEGIDSLQASCFGLAINTSSELEKGYCEMYTREGYAKRAYCLGPVALLPRPGRPDSGSCSQQHQIILDWLDSKPNRSVVYLSFGSLAQVKDAQLDEISLGLEASGVSFLWVVREKEGWSTPAGWEERVRDQDRGFIIRTWAPQTAILRHPAVGAFVTQCGWNSIMETVAAGVPVLTWPMAYEQFITERQLTEVLGIGERLWPEGAGIRSESHEEHEVVPAQDVARAITVFMRPGGPGDAARIKVKVLAQKLHAAVAEGGSSHRDLHRLVNDLMAAAEAKRT